jgi:hypothetical protein
MGAMAAACVAHLASKTQLRATRAAFGWNIVLVAASLALAYQPP